MPVESTLEVQGTRCKLTCLVEHEGLYSEVNLGDCGPQKMWGYRLQNKQKQSTHRFHSAQNAANIDNSRSSSISVEELVDPNNAKAWSLDILDFCIEVLSRIRTRQIPLRGRRQGPAAPFQARFGDLISQFVSLVDVFCYPMFCHVSNSVITME